MVPLPDNISPTSFNKLYQLIQDVEEGIHRKGECTYFWELTVQSPYAVSLNKRRDFV